jgi:ABC-2 type transport system ATP-binding protein
MAKPIIVVKNLIKKYKKAEFNAVDDISFDVKEGEFFCFLGPNGAGKTTTISILTTTLSRTSGDIKIAGFDTEKQSSKVRQNVGIIFQNPSLDMNLTAEENVRFHAVLYGIHDFRPSFDLMPTEYKKRVIQLAEVIGLGKDIFRPIKTFSGGMRRKLEIIRSLMHKPKILFLDEPSIGLDPISRKALWDYLTWVRKQEKMTIFLTTHYLEEDADRVCILSRGKIIALGTPEHIKRSLIQEYLILDSKNRKKLEDELKSLKLTFSESGPFKVQLDGKNAQKVIQLIHTPLDMLKTHSPTLEEAYVELIEKPNLSGVDIGAQT